ncbi:MAG: 50S ribosomal protein L4 [Actinomycetota bacterium]|nr:50S ribosomal protein L4 [Actinomycetota bacterium]
MSAAEAKLKAKVIDSSGSASGDIDLPAEIFGGEVNVPVMHQVVTAQLAAARSGTASTKTRSEVRGGGTKPWRQKGTGRARHGSIRSPIWVGGGVVWGPKPRSHAVRVNRKVRKAALRSALADKAQAGRVWVLDGFEETKTKAAAACLKAAGVEGKVLLVLDPEDETSRTVDRAFRNLGSAAFALVGSLSTYDILVADALFFTRGAYDKLVNSGRLTTRSGGDGA